MAKINKQPNNWTDADIIKLLRGEAQMGGNVSAENMVAEINKRFDSEFETLDEAIEAQKEEVNVEEIEEEAQAEEKKEEVVEEEPAKAEPEPAPEPKPTAEPAPKPSNKDGLSDTEIVIMSDIEDYIDRMMPGRSHAGQEGIRTQTKLWRNIQAILRTEGPVFTKLFSFLLDQVNKHRDTVFNEYNVFRYFESLKIPPNERRNFERMLNLLLTTSNPSTRNESLKQVDLEATMEGFQDTEVHQKVAGFYQNI